MRGAGLHRINLPGPCNHSRDYHGPALALHRSWRMNRRLRSLTWWRYEEPDQAATGPMCAVSVGSL